MFSVEFSCCVCSCLQNWRSEGSSLEQKSFFFILCLLLCLFVLPLPSHLHDAAGFLSPIPEGGGCQEICRVAGAAWTGMYLGLSLQQQEVMEVLRQSQEPPLHRLREGKSKCEFIRSLEVPSVLSLQMLTMLILLPVWEYR